MDIDVSVVVPVYNTELYLKECIESLIHQTLKNAEFIFVDDGSTDSSVKIIEEYRRKDHRIRLIQQKNQHAGVARNKGLEEARGKYIIFLDSDDFFELNMLEEALRHAEENQAEVTVFGYYSYDNQTKTVEAVPVLKREETTFSPDQLGDQVFSTFLEVPWNKLFLRQYVEENELRFQTIYKHNDVFFAQLSIALANRITIVDRCFVYYRINNSKSLQGNTDDSWLYLTECYSALKKALTDRDRFHGAVREAYIKTACTAIEYRSSLEKKSSLSDRFYSELKRRLIPELFESPKDFEDAELLHRVYCSEDYDNYIFLWIESKDKQIRALQNTIKMLREETVSKKCKDYLVGHTILKLPRAVYYRLCRVDQRNDNTSI